MKDKKNGYIYYEYHEKSEKEVISETAWKSVFHWLYVIVGVLFVFFVAWMMFFHIISVDGDSMLPTLRDNDKLFVYTFNYTPEQGDIIVISMPEYEDYLLVKRVIAFENQTVDVDYNSGTVTVDGKVLDEKYASAMNVRSDNEIAYPYTVPNGCVFVMGDNRNESRDSRSRGIGCIDENRIVGKALFRISFSSDRNIYDQ